jgi:Uma2 family endonuclease
MTFEQFVARDDDRKADLIDGYLSFDMPTYQHENLFAFLLSVLRFFVADRDLGVVLGSRTPVRTSEEAGYEPDLVFVAVSRTEIIEPLYLSAAPDLAVEIVSKSSLKKDYVDKREAYERMGVREYWLLDIVSGQATLFRLGEDGRFANVTPAAGERFESAVVEGFRFDPADLLAETLPKESAFLRGLLDETA